MRIEGDVGHKGMHIVSASSWRALRQRGWREELRQRRVPSVHAFGDPGPWPGKLLNARKHA
jgi:hypothetical protein